MALGKCFVPECIALPARGMPSLLGSVLTPSACATKLARDSSARIPALEDFTFDIEKDGKAWTGLGVRPRNTGSEPLRLLILFNAPTYEEILLTSWLTTNPLQLVADHFGLDLEQVANFLSNEPGSWS